MFSNNFNFKICKFYNDMETPVQIILGPIGSGKTFALQMKIIRLACEQIPVPRVEEEIVGRGSNRISIAEEQLTSHETYLIFFY
jgi:Ni2+-binding GTPase involved in maturation of urease and hydrogenase